MAIGNLKKSAAEKLMTTRRMREHNYGNVQVIDFSLHTISCTRQSY